MPRVDCIPRLRAEGEVCPHARIMGVSYPLVGILILFVLQVRVWRPSNNKRAEVRCLLFYTPLQEG